MNNVALIEPLSYKANPRNEQDIKFFKLIHWKNQCAHLILIKRESGKEGKKQTSGKR